MKYTIFGCLVAVIIVLSGCSTILENDISDIEQEQSYVPMVNLNGTIYASYDLTKYEKYSTGEVFGEIKRRVPSSDIEKENLTSNYYDEGTVIYNVKEDNKIFLIEESPDIYSILEKLE